MANVKDRVRTLATRIENSDTMFRRNILNNTVQLIPLNKKALLAHAKVQVRAIAELLDQRKVNDSTAQGLASVLYNEIKKNLLGFSHPSVVVAKLGSTPIDKKLLASAGLQFSSSTLVFRARSTSTSPARLDKILNAIVLAPANLKAVSYLNKFKRKAAIISPQNDILVLTPMFSSSSTFKATVRELVKSAQRVPEENRTKYLNNIRDYAAKAIKTVNRSYTNADWALQVTGKHSVSLKKIASTATITLALTAPPEAKPTQLAKIEREALKALLKSGKDNFEALILQDSGVLPKIEKMLVDAAITSITKKKLNRNSKGTFISKKDILKGVTKVGSVRSRGLVWKAKGREALADITKNLLGIKNILNEFLPAQMEKNMGKGNSKTVLNYRTGRLADSAEVLLVHPIRNNVITARVNYLQNPYRTFAPGGDKSDPPTRNPKRLLDKSIRQILREKLQFAMAFKSELG
jgi:hypothetical protein